MLGEAYDFHAFPFPNVMFTFLGQLTTQRTRITLFSFCAILSSTAFPLPNNSFSPQPLKELQANNLLDVNVDDRGGGSKVGGVVLEVVIVICGREELVRVEGKTTTVLFCETDGNVLDGDGLLLIKEILVQCSKTTIRRGAHFAVKRFQIDAAFFPLSRERYKNLHINLLA